jgi:hypothetical protein
MAGDEIDYFTSMSDLFPGRGARVESTSAPKTVNPFFQVKSGVVTVSDTNVDDQSFIEIDSLRVRLSM